MVKGARSGTKAGHSHVGNEEAPLGWVSGGTVIPPPRGDVKGGARKTAHHYTERSNSFTVVT